jgi:hypothetical protein
MKSTFVQILIAVSVLLLSPNTQAGDKQKLDNWEKEFIADCENEGQKRNLDQVNKESQDMMNNLFADRTTGQKPSKRKQKKDDGMMVTLRFVKR